MELVLIGLVGLASVVLGVCVVVVGMLLGVEVQMKAGPGGFTVETGRRRRPPAKKRPRSGS